MSIAEKIIIVGFSGFGKEVLFLAKRLGVEVQGFLDDSLSVQGEKFAGASVLGCVTQWQEYSDCKFVIAIGNPAVREKIYNDMLTYGNIYCAYSPRTDNAALTYLDQFRQYNCCGVNERRKTRYANRKHVIINLNCTIGHDSKVGDFATIAPMVAVSGNVNVGRSVEIGTSASVRQGLSIGNGAMLGMGSVLTKDMPENVVFFGSPAKCIRKI